MNRIADILAHPLFHSCMDKIAFFEQNRIFCRHDRQHLLDVARIAYILVLEQGLPYSREFIYALALLHDLGRATEYQGGEKHRVSGPGIARKILAGLSFPSDEVNLICTAIAQHGKKESADLMSLAGLFSRADFLARDCAVCAAQEVCKWPVKNQPISY